MTSQPFEERLAKLKAMLRARNGRPGFSKNVEDIQSEISRLEGVLAGIRSGDPVESSD